MTIRVKICGITQIEDAVKVATLGADAIGLVFYSGSPRCVSVEQAQKIVRSLPPFVSTVGLFVNHSESEVRTILQTVPLDILQFHGDETALFCSQFHRPYIKAIRVQTTDNIQQALGEYSSARALLLDTYRATQYGGTGQTFNWNLIPQDMPMPWILAGGLNVDNIAYAIHQSGARAVDVSGGVESCIGKKDLQKVKQFIQVASGCQSSIR